MSNIIDEYQKNNWTKYHDLRNSSIFILFYLPYCFISELIIKPKILSIRIQNIYLTGPQMQPAVKEIGQWRKDMGIVSELVWAHCNAHIEPALNTALTKVLLKIEEVLG